MTPPSLDGPRLSPLNGGPARQLVVILHGYGADGMDLIDVGRAWQGQLPDAAFIAPDAPELLPFEAFGGRQWFALSDRSPEEIRIGTETALPVLDRFLDQELATLGLTAENLVLAGFSQGAMMALQSGLRRYPQPGGIIAYSGRLPGLESINAAQSHCPVLLVHGAEDEVVPAYHLSAAESQLTKAGVAVDAHLLADLGHSIDERGLVLGGRFLRTVFGA